MMIGLGDTDAEARLVQCSEPAPADGKEVRCVDYTGVHDVLAVVTGCDSSAASDNNQSRSAKRIGTVDDIQDPLWRSPFWSDYAPWLDNSLADLKNVSNAPHFAAIGAALFLRRFVNSEKT